ncbi:hypothetical protein [Ralstonia pseudosolanacearum]|uniref:hypothetical protein n=1 Tax=Ralstonia pseudosolanacearum TaxID=1310165 RepID=UPI001FFC1CAB|nr:hypothetical protein [Ralstonia pseudosolanacearum]
MARTRQSRPWTIRRHDVLHGQARLGKEPKKLPHKESLLRFADQQRRLEGNAIEAAILGQLNEVAKPFLLFDVTAKLPLRGAQMYPHHAATRKAA